MFDFDPEKVLRENDVKVEWSDQVVDSEGKPRTDPCPGYYLIWKQGVIYIGNCSELKARESAAIFIHLWLNGISAQMADHLIQAYAHIERYRAAVEQYENLLNNTERFMREGVEMIHTDFLDQVTGIAGLPSAQLDPRCS